MLATLVVYICKKKEKLPSCGGEADAGGVAVELPRAQCGGDGVLGLDGRPEGREHGGVAVRQGQHGPRAVLPHAGADLVPHRPDAHLGPRDGQHALLGPRELPIHRLRLRRSSAVAFAVHRVMRSTVALAVAVRRSEGAIAVALFGRHDEEAC